MDQRLLRVWELVSWTVSGLSDLLRDVWSWLGAAIKAVGAYLWATVVCSWGAIVWSVEDPERLENLVTSVGIVVAGIWTYRLFVKRRQRYPRAQVAHAVTYRAVAADRIYVRVFVCIENAGDVLLRVMSVELRVEQLLPIPPEVETLFDNSGPLDPEGQIEAPWLLLWHRIAGDQQIEIEPGEKDGVVFDVLLPAGIEVIALYSYTRNVTRSRWRWRWPFPNWAPWRWRLPLGREPKEIGWRLNTTYDLSKPMDEGGDNGMLHSENKDKCSSGIDKRQGPPKPVRPATSPTPPQPSPTKPPQQLPKS